jgi:regulator of RNase E activity RraA
MKAIVAEYMKLSTPNVSDALDRLGIEGTPRGILPLYAPCRKIVGPAMTMRLVPLGGKHTASPVIGTLEAIVAADAGDVLVIDQQGRPDVNSFGGVAGFTTKHRGLAGVVMDGVTRDIDEFQGYDLPVYGTGAITQSIRNRCAYAGCGIDVHLGPCLVRRGDLIMADQNGICIVPREKIKEALKIAIECKETEDRVVEVIKRGADPVTAHEKVRYDMMTGTHAAPVAAGTAKPGKSKAKSKKK